jgi:hypothetical protein
MGVSVVLRRPADALRRVHDPSKSVDALDRLLPVEELSGALQAEPPGGES